MLGKTMISTIEKTVRIIVDDNFGERLVDPYSLQWRTTEFEEMKYPELTLDEIAEQIETDGIIYVWVESGLSGEIYLHNNAGDGRWVKHGETRGYA